MQTKLSLPVSLLTQALQNRTELRNIAVAETIVAGTAISVRDRMAMAAIGEASRIVRIGRRGETSVPCGTKENMYTQIFHDNLTIVDSLGTKPLDGLFTAAR
jgi:uncharacterized NAD(P)/FAD-binding protein YdhS